ncbi:MAG: hypothetical protein ACTIMJ_01545 [Weissella hellenica]|uniref:hypothetical protein n=1 Tax=Weissella hellenica TaxID=46256 RepID=UPI003F9915DD
MFFKLKRLQQRFSYYFGYMWSFFFYIAPSFIAVDMFNQGEVKFGLVFVCFGFFMSVLCFMTSREKQKRYHETQVHLLNLMKKFERQVMNEYRILAEKPSQVRAYVEAFQHNTKKPVYFEVSDPVLPSDTTITLISQVGKERIVMSGQSS